MFQRSLLGPRLASMLQSLSNTISDPFASCMCGQSTCGRQDLQRELAILLVLVRVLLPRAPQLAALAPRQRRRGFGLLSCCCLHSQRGQPMSALTQLELRSFMGTDMHIYSYRYKGKGAHTVLSQMTSWACTAA